MLHKRQQQIRQILAHHPRCGVQELQDKLGVSRATIRRDLIDLEQQGVLVRVHGGVVHSDYLAGEPTFDRRHQQRSIQKRRIGQTASELIKSNQTVFIDAGSTCLEVARRLLLREDIKLFTHSVRVLVEAQRGQADVTCIGGTLRRVSEALVDTFALNWLENLHFDVAIIGASGLCLKQGLSTTELSEAAVKQEVITRSEQVILAADSSKAGHPTAVNFAKWDQVSDWVVDQKIDRPRGSRYRLIVADQS
ncbi:MAG TPA: DeoR/GlpR transcriptional regulator [Phycisphaerales bacterium]|nr:DeoR/GlpR transcriptional regulator [Phycisphaerales bacterium]|tara:strand:+ start:1112 stop:1861 length:750 start_codon:yes stop_codon:yes gene_type:complete